MVLANALSIKIIIFTRTHVLAVPPEPCPLEVVTIRLLKTGEYYDALSLKKPTPVLSTLDDLLYHTDKTLLHTESPPRDNFLTSVSSCLAQHGRQIDVDALRKMQNAACFCQSGPPPPSLPLP